MAGSIMNERPWPDMPKEPPAVMAGGSLRLGPGVPEAIWQRPGFGRCMTGATRRLSARGHGTNAAPVSSRTLPDTSASSPQPFHTAYWTQVALNRLPTTCTLVPWPGSGQRIE